MQPLQNIAISASAGSGKTHALTNRFIYLLHYFEAPERILALTFTRSAAGEFFDKIIRKLAAAAADPDAAAELSGQLGIEADGTRYRQLLRRLLDRMHRLNLQTLDGFFHRIVSCFALELGLPGGIHLLDESAEPRIRNQVRDSILVRRDAPDASMKEFWEAFKQATYGREQRGVEGIVSEYVEQLYNLYLEAPAGDLWGRADRIWPKGCIWNIATPDWNQLADDLLANPPSGLTNSQRTDLENAAKLVRNYPVEQKTNTLLDRALADASGVLGGRVSLKSGKGKNTTVTFEGSACRALAEAVRAIVGYHLHHALQDTAGVHRILKAYHRQYEQLVRRAGRLCFSDLTYLLSPANDGSPLQQPEPGVRELMDFRLDARFDHWLFDEFQDTSRPQWNVVANLVDEILQDPSGERSLFYVGDTKQCLYLWRNSDDRLFHEILHHYAGTLENRTLARSWRSAPAILDAVNRVFGDPPAIAAHFSREIADRWNRAWARHDNSPNTSGQSGHVSWLRADEREGPTRNELIADYLTELNPLARGLEVGILVRKNEDANEIADYLRGHTRFPVHTGSAVRPALDNSAGAALLAFIRLAAHPGDPFARGFLRLIEQATGGPALSQATPAFRTHLLTESAESAVRRASEHIAAHLPEEDSRHRNRLEDLVHAARAFDNEECRDPDSLLDYLESFSSGEAAPGEAITVETIHKAKGLEYDVVLLVEEENKTSLQLRNTITALRNTAGQPEWVLEPIPKKLMQADPQLNRLREQGESTGGFEALCRLYVAMTRARRNLCMISTPKSPQAGSLVEFLGDRLGNGFETSDCPLFQNKTYPLIWETGERSWYTGFPENEAPDRTPATDQSPASKKSTPGKPEPDTRDPATRLRLARPSADKANAVPAGSFFDLDEESSAWGTSLHHAFEQLEWLHSGETAAQATERATAGSEAWTPEVRETLRACLDEPAIRARFTRKSGDTSCELWRERSFSLVEGSELVNGIFDRVHLHKDEKNRVTSATILDFKTDRIRPGDTGEAAGKHRPQLETYKRALAGITGLPPDKIRAEILFTHPRKLVSL